MGREGKMSLVFFFLFPLFRGRGAVGGGTSEGNEDVSEIHDEMI